MQWSLNEIIELLCSMIATPSLSRNEGDVADLVEQSLRSRGIEISIIPDYYYRDLQEG